MNHARTALAAVAVGGGVMREPYVPIHKRMGVIKSERRRLWNYECGWCCQRLARLECGAIFDRCTEEERHERRQRCLNSLKRKERTP